MWFSWAMLEKTVVQARDLVDCLVVGLDLALTDVRLVAGEAGGAKPRAKFGIELPSAAAASMSASSYSSFSFSSLSSSVKASKLLAVDAGLGAGERGRAVCVGS